MSIKAVILSLPKDAERRRQCEQELSFLGVAHEFSDAIPGDQIARGNLFDPGDIASGQSKFKRPLSANEVACTLGHRKIWRRIAQSDQSVGLVLEDDATFLRDPRQLFQDLSDRASCFEDVMIKLDGVAGRNVQVIGALAGQNLVISDRLPPRTTGYILGRRAAARLLESGNPVARPVDINLKFYWEHKVPILTLDSKMVTERATFTSNIDSCRQKAKSRSPLNRFVRNLIYQVKYTHGRLNNPLIPERIEGLGPVLRAQSQLQDHQ